MLLFKKNTQRLLQEVQKARWKNPVLQAMIVLRASRIFNLLRRANMSSNSNGAPDIVLDAFAMRQFNDERKGTPSHIEYDPEKFMEEVLRIYNDRKARGETPLLHDGYAPFCKHVFIPNFVGAVASYLPVTPENEHLLKTSYEARTDKELPVLTRYFPKEHKDISPVEATHLDLILYSREQIEKENKAMGNPPTSVLPFSFLLCQ